MIEKFKSNLFRLVPEALTMRFLLAVSGGIDSATLCHLFYRTGITFGIAHCNFCLRGKESEADAQFVKQLSDTYKVSFFAERFNTKKFSTENNISIQMAARELRYQWLRAVKTENNYNFIATAHHLNDQVETVLLNMIRGSGIRGLLGISALDNDLVRPLLFASKVEIANYATNESIQWREDSSNMKTNYTRNFLRLKVIPLIKKINPSFENTIAETIEKLTIPLHLYEKKIIKLKKTLKFSGIYPHKINADIMLENFSTPPLLWEFLSAFGFTYSQCRDILNSLKKQPGKQFFTKSHRIVIDREQIILDNANINDPGEFLISETEKEIHTSKFNISISEKNVNNLKINRSNLLAYLDKNKLRFPLVLRKWKTGDWFIPFGMKGRKKISDFLIDIKLTRIEKENVRVLASGKDICWVAGFRIDERFKVTSSAKRIWIGNLIKN